MRAMVDSPLDRPTTWSGTPEQAPASRPSNRTLPMLAPTPGPTLPIGPDDAGDPSTSASHDETPYRLHHRFDRMGRLVGDAGIERLLRARIMVIGVGGVGSFAAESLARSAVGTIALVDFDRICITNANRQIQALAHNAGHLKTTVLAERLRQINPQCRTDILPVFYSESTSDMILNWRPDYIIDAIDNITAKCHLLAECRARGVRVVSSLGAAGRMDPSSIASADLADSKMDPMGRVIRKILRQQYRFPRSGKMGILAVYSSEPARDPIELHYDKGQGFRCLCPGEKNDFHSCEERRVIYGTASFVTGTFGLFCTAAVIRALVQDVPTATA